MAVIDYTGEIQKLYVAYFNRPADYEGLAHWNRVLNGNGGDIDFVSSFFAQSNEYKDQNAGKSYYQIVNQIYLNLFNRNADLGGLEHWAGHLRAGTFTVDQIVKVIADNASDAGDDKDATTYANKVAAATAFTAELNTAPEIIGYGGEKAIQAAKAWLSTVGNDASLKAAIAPAALQATVAAVVETGNAQSGQTLTLTASADNVAGTNGNDTINVVYTNQLGQNATTWQAFDVIDGGAGTDTMNIYAKTGGHNFSQAGTVTGVEIVNVFNAEAGEDAFAHSSGIDASKFQGVQQIWQIEGNADISKLAASTTAGFRGDAKVDAAIGAANDAASINVVLDMADVTGNDGSGDAGNATVNLDVSGLTLNAVNLSGELSYEGETACGNLAMMDGAVNLKISKSTDTVALNSVFNTTVTFDSTTNPTLTTLNAVASTGDITVLDGNLGSGDDIGEGQLQNVTTGSGDDVVVVTFDTTATKAAAVVTNAGEDLVLVKTDGAGKTSVDTGADDDTIAVIAASAKLAVAAGAGDDVLVFDRGFEENGEAIVELAVDMGAGDDAVMFNNYSLDTLPADWVINGGAGTDAVRIGSGNARTFSAQDYTAITENLVGFEHISLAGEDDESVVIDASRMTGYSTIAREGGDMTITKVTNQEIGMIGSDADVLNVTASGYSAGASTVYGADLTVFAEDVTGAKLTAKGNSLTLAVDATALDADLTVAGDVKTMSVTLNSTVLDNSAPCPDDLEDIGFVQASVKVKASDLAAMTSLTLSGTGAAQVTNSNGAKLATVNAADLTNLYWDSAEAETAVGYALEYTTTNAGVAEVITLGSGLDVLTFDSNEFGIVSFGSETAGSTATLEVDGLSEIANFTVSGLTVTYDADGSGAAEAKVLTLDKTYATFADFVSALDAIEGITASHADGTITIAGAAASTISFTEFSASAGVLFASTVAKTDTVNGLKLVEDASMSDAIDSDLSDLIAVSLDDSDISGPVSAFEKLTTAQAASVAGKSSLGLALNEVALIEGKQYVAFVYGGNTYLYGDVNYDDNGRLAGTGENDRVDDGDLLIKLTGVQDLDLLLSSLNSMSGA